MLDGFHPVIEQGAEVIDAMVRSAVDIDVDGISGARDVLSENVFLPLFVSMFEAKTIFMVVDVVLMILTCLSAAMAFPAKEIAITRAKKERSATCHPLNKWRRPAD